MSNRRGNPNPPRSRPQKIAEDNKRSVWVFPNELYKELERLAKSVGVDMHNFLVLMMRVMMVIASNRSNPDHVITIKQGVMTITDKNGERSSDLFATEPDKDVDAAQT